MENRLVERFLRYIQMDTVSMVDSDQIPSTEPQLRFTQMLAEELREMGVAVDLADTGVLYAHVPSNTSGEEPAIGFIAHVDTPPGHNSSGISPRILRDYDGGTIDVNEALGMKMEPQEYPFLPELRGHDLILSDGTTILGADDKAGVAELITLLELLAADSSIRHGAVYAAFTVDEEIGKGMDYFELELFPVDFAYTVDIDGNAVDCLDYETISDVRADVEIVGKPVHPGNAEGVIRNALMIAMDFQKRIPEKWNPFNSNGRKGFIHLQELRGEVGQAAMRFRVSAFEEEELQQEIETLMAAAQEINHLAAYHAVSVRTERQSYNMKPYVTEDPRCLEFARKAMERVGIIPRSCPIRGGTDGAKLSRRGIPTPNLNNGSYNALSYCELVSIQNMKKALEIQLAIVTV